MKILLVCALHIVLATSHSVQDMINRELINKPATESYEEASLESETERPRAANIPPELVQNDWATLKGGVTIRLFKPSDYFSSTDPTVIWKQMGTTISCTINEKTGDAEVDIPNSDDFNPDFPFKLLAHGYGEGFGNFTRGSGVGNTALSDYYQMLIEWMNLYNETVNVVFVDWSILSSRDQWKNWHNYKYDTAARNCIDVGTYLGYCLAGLSSKYNVSAANIHLVGHSLGSHVVGNAGNAFTRKSDQKVARVTGLDPAGPRFWDGPLLSAIPELKRNRINKTAGAFVDIIHTDGGSRPCVYCLGLESPHRGSIHQIGHMDFYPDGGSLQQACAKQESPGGCSHGIVPHYYYLSIRNTNKFEAKECSSVTSCKNQIVSDHSVKSYMGEEAHQHWQKGTSKLFTLKIDAI